jgi:hypothetical protein
MCGIRSSNGLRYENVSLPVVASHWRFGGQLTPRRRTLPTVQTGNPVRATTNLAFGHAISA